MSEEVRSSALELCSSPFWKEPPIFMMSSTSSFPSSISKNLTSLSLSERTPVSLFFPALLPNNCLPSGCSSRFLVHHSSLTCLLFTHLGREIRTLAPNSSPPWPPITAAVVPIPCCRALTPLTSTSAPQRPISSTGKTNGLTGDNPAALCWEIEFRLDLPVVACTVPSSHLTDLLIT